MKRRITTKIGPAHTTKTNPFLGGLAEKAGAHAALHAAAEKAQNEFWSASLVVRALEREAERFEVTERGTRVPSGFPERLESARELAARAEGVFQRAAERARQAAGQLLAQQKAAETWTAREQYFDGQAEQVDSLTPRQRAIREARELLAHEGMGE